MRVLIQQVGKQGILIYGPRMEKRRRNKDTSMHCTIDLVQ